MGTVWQRSRLFPSPSCFEKGAVVRYAAIFEQQIMLNAVEDRLEEEGRVQMRLVYQMFRRGYDWPEIAVEVGEADSEPVKRRVYRWMKKMGGE